MSSRPSRILSAPGAFMEVAVEGTAPMAARIQPALFAGLCLLLFSAPLAMGAVFPWSVLALEAGAAALLILWIARELCAARVRVTWNPLFGPALLFAAVIAAQFAFHTSAVPALTRYEALKYVAYALLMFTAVQAVRSDDQYRRFAAVAIVFGLGVALFAIVQDFTWNGMLYWMFRPSFPSRPFGPYVNHNHFAGLMELLAPLPLALAVALKSLTPGKRALLAFAAILMAGSVALSGSRGGMLAVGAEILLLGGYVAGRRALRPAAVLAVACVLMGAFLWWIGSEQILARFSADQGPTLSMQTRLRITRSAVRMARERPVLGWGLGTFSTVYPPFRDFYGDRFINQAHDDYAQFLAETGAVGFAAVLWFVGTLLACGARRSHGADEFIGSAVKLGLLLGCAGVLVHSFADFNLQIPANAALFYVFAALAASPEASAHALIRHIPLRHSYRNMR
ncbi:MAG: O-antigen ligase family protein [Acidobacteria bacterium]|nr:O-antigen ligase family protein [Acidobacteriota bacterium]